MHPDDMLDLVTNILNEVWSGNLAILEDHPGLHESIPFLTQVMETSTDRQHQIMEQLVDGDWVVTRFITDATQTVEFMGVPAGTRIRAETIQMMRIEDGIVVKQHAQGGRID